MKRLMQVTMAMLLTALVSVPALAQPADAVRAEDAVVDALVARPVGVVATVLGSALFVVSLPFSALGGNVDDAAQALVVGPAKETFTRCLGCRPPRQNIRRPR